MFPVVNFTGGLGAQLLSLAICLDFQNTRKPFGVDLTYFSGPRKTAGPGEGISVWPWQIDSYGFSQQDVLRMSFEKPLDHEPKLLSDSPQKLKIALAALEKPSIRGVIPAGDVAAIFSEFRLEFLSEEPFLAGHLRRGDYLNVASNVISESAYLETASEFRSLVRQAVFVSDSPSSAKFKSHLRTIFAKCYFIEGEVPDVVKVHQLLRAADILLGSNGQFGMTAGLLGSGLFLTPFDGHRRVEYDSVTNGLGSFLVHQRQTTA